MKYLALSETGGVLTDDRGESSYVLTHEGDIVVANIVPKGGRPTIVNKQFAESFIKEWCEFRHFKMKEIPKEKIDKAANQLRYRSMHPDQSILSPEYQLYLAHELEREIIRKGSKVKEDRYALKELSGLLPHEEEQDEH